MCVAHSSRVEDREAAAAINQYDGSRRRARVASAVQCRVVKEGSEWLALEETNRNRVGSSSLSSWKFRILFAHTNAQLKCQNKRTHTTAARVCVCVDIGQWIRWSENVLVNEFLRRDTAFQ